MTVRRTGIFFALCFLLAALTARAAHTHVQLLLSAQTAKPGDTIWAGVDLKMDAGWHTYWKNPGDSGIATTIKWDLPPGISAGEIQWPLPEKLPPAEVTTYGYEDEVMLLVPLKIETNLPSGKIDLKAAVSWLECQEQCVPGSTNVGATLTIGSETKNSADWRTIGSWKNKLPQKSSYPELKKSGIDTDLPIQAWWEKSNEKDLRPLIIRLPHFSHPDLILSVEKADFFPDANDQFEVQAATEEMPDASSEFQLRKTVKKFSGDWPKEISGVVILQKGDVREGVEVNLTITDKKPFEQTTNQSTQSLWQMLLYAFIGGLILNIMPCVLPVIALKILGFVSEARSEPRRVRNLGLVYALGVLISFLALAGIVIAVKAAGHLAGWGMQFGSPIFLVFLTTLVTLVALNLFGVFEVTLGGGALDKAGELASRHGASGAFFNGVLATILATPCTAPFLGAALGFAFLQSPAIIILIFIYVGLGLSAPYVLLSFNPALLKFLPKPGAWMEKFKIAMGFPMLATVVWLFNISASSYGKNVLWLGVFLVVVALAAWIFGEFFQRGQKHRTAAIIVVLILLAGGYAFALENQLHWRAAVSENEIAGSTEKSADGIDWQKWSPETVAAARAVGKPVLVDFTADWCLTCQVNKKTSIDVLSVQKKLKDLNVATLVGDYTRTPENITAELQKYNRAGVPLVLVYPKNADAPPIVLPEVLTPGIVLAALEQAAK